MTPYNYIDVLTNKASQSLSNYKVSGIAFNKKGEVLGVAYNTFRLNKKGGGIHAEMALIRRYGTLIKSMIICRVGNSGDILPIEPCTSCKKVLDKLNIRVVSIEPKD